MRQGLVFSRSVVAGAVVALAATIAGLAHAAGGTFTPADGSPFAVTASPNSIVAGEFNGDHDMDLAVPNDGADTVTILLEEAARGASRTAATSLSGARPRRPQPAI